MIEVTEDAVLIYILGTEGLEHGTGEKETERRDYSSPNKCS